MRSVKKNHNSQVISSFVNTEIIITTEHLSPNTLSLQQSTGKCKYVGKAKHGELAVKDCRQWKNCKQEVDTTTST